MNNNELRQPINIKNKIDIFDKMYTKCIQNANKMSDNL